MKITFTDNEKAIFQKIAAAAKKQGVECYAIGGFVRDKIIGRVTKDIDIVCSGNGIALAEETAKHFQPRPQVTIFKTFGTAQIKLDKHFSTEPLLVGRETYLYRAPRSSNLFPPAKKAIPPKAATPL